MRHSAYRFISIGTGLFTVLFFAAVVGGNAHAAAQRTSITISPTDKHYTVDPGDTISDTVKVLNSGETTFNFSTYASPYSVADKTYDPNYDDSSVPRADAYKWISFTQGTYTLDAGKNIDIPFTLHISKDASPGGHYGVIFAETQPSANATGFVLEKHRVGLIIYVNVSGETHLAGSVKSISINQFQPVAPMVGSATVENTGNVDFRADISYVVSDVLGKEKYKFTDERYVMPNTNRVIDLSWDSCPWIGIYKAKISITALGKTKTNESYVVVAPVWLLFVVLLALVLVVVSLVRRSKGAPKQMRRHR